MRNILFELCVCVFFFFWFLSDVFRAEYDELKIDIESRKKLYGGLFYCSHCVDLKPTDHIQRAKGVSEFEVLLRAHLRISNWEPFFDLWRPVPCMSACRSILSILPILKCQIQELFQFKREYKYCTKNIKLFIISCFEFFV